MTERVEEIELYGVLLPGLVSCFGRLFAGLKQP